MKTARFLTDLFAGRTTQPVFFTSLPNERRGSNHPKLVTRDPDAVERFIQKHDQPERALYFCVGTLQPGKTWRNKENLSELHLLHADLDLKNIIASRKEVLDTLAKLPLPPNQIVFSGHGFHGYWLLKKAMAATPENIKRVECALKQLARVIAGDPSVCEVARLMRLPGSHNTKHGEWIEVRVVARREGAYSLKKLEQWLEKGVPVLQRRPSENNGADPFLEVDHCGFKPPLDVEQLLDDMQWHGTGGGGNAHHTLLRVTAALLSRGWDIEDAIVRSLVALGRAAERSGTTEDPMMHEPAIRRMCTEWLRKHPRITKAQRPDRYGAPDIHAVVRKLRLIDPDCDSRTRFQIACALHNTLGDEVGFLVFDSWSRHGTKYDVAKVSPLWMSIRRADGYGYRFGTIVHYSKVA